MDKNKFQEEMEQVASKMGQAISNVIEGVNYEVILMAFINVHTAMLCTLIQPEYLKLIAMRSFEILMKKIDFELEKKEIK